MFEDDDDYDEESNEGPAGPVIDHTLKLEDDKLVIEVDAANLSAAVSHHVQRGVVDAYCRHRENIRGIAKEQVERLVEEHWRDAVDAEVKAHVAELVAGKGGFVTMEKQYGEEKAVPLKDYVKSLFTENVNGDNYHNRKPKLTRAQKWVQDMVDHSIKEDLQAEMSQLRERFRTALEDTLTKNVGEFLRAKLGG